MRPLHKYQPVLHVVKNCSSHGVELASFSFQETQFVAVTAYQNEKVSDASLAAGYPIIAAVFHAGYPVEDTAQPVR